MTIALHTVAERFLKSIAVKWILKHSSLRSSLRIRDKQYKTKIVSNQPAFTCSKLTIKTLEQGGKYVQS